LSNPIGDRQCRCVQIIRTNKVNDTFRRVKIMGKVMELDEVTMKFGTTWMTWI
jgi:hypothetical protein